MSSAYEAETTIRFDEESGSAEVYTASPRIARMLTARGLQPIRIDRNRREITGWTFELPKFAVILKPDATAIRIGGRRIAASAHSKQLGCVSG